MTSTPSPVTASTVHDGAARRNSTVVPPTAVPPKRHPDAPAPGERIESHYGRCFGCGERHPTGLHMSLTAGEGVSVTAQFVVTADHQGAPGLAHGGLLSCAFDEAMGALIWLLRKPAVTGRLETDFLRPVPVGSRLLITARCTGVQGRKVYAEAEGRFADGDADNGIDGCVARSGGVLAVRAAAVFIQVELAHFRQHGRAEDLEAVQDDPAVRRMAQAFDVNP